MGIFERLFNNPQNGNGEAEEVNNSSKTKKAEFLDDEEIRRAERSRNYQSQIDGSTANRTGVTEQNDIMWAQYGITKRN